MEKCNALMRKTTEYCEFSEVVDQKIAIKRIRSKSLQLEASVLSIILWSQMLQQSYLNEPVHHCFVELAEFTDNAN